jgi:PHYB activation tagged suppressor 1
MNWHKWMLEKKLRSLLTQIRQPRLANGEYGNDLLGVFDSVLHWNEARREGNRSQPQHGGDHTWVQAVLRWSWKHIPSPYMSVYLLSIFPEWQERPRKEVLREFGRESPNPNALSKLREARKHNYAFLLQWIYTWFMWDFNLWLTITSIYCRWQWCSLRP